MNTTSTPYKYGDVDAKGRVFTSYTKYKTKDGKEKLSPSFISPETLHTHRIKSVMRNAKKRADAKNVPFSVTEEYLRSIFPSDGNCPVFNTPLVWGVKSKDKNRNSPSLDRINPTLGYVEGNVIWVSLKANAIKTDATPDEILEVGRFYKNLHM